MQIDWLSWIVVRYGRTYADGDVEEDKGNRYQDSCPNLLRK